MHTGKVWLIGCGPGDMELLTLKAARILQSADVWLVDDLAGKDILTLARADARIVHVGKRGGCRSTPQHFINRLMARYARKVRDIFRPAPPLPPHIAAIQALETLHNQKLWQSGRHKQYYSGLTDILRTYLAGRYGFGAMEMTSDEILAAVRRYDLPQKCVMDLQAILRDADLVKFAKARPEGTTNEDNYLNAYYFVEETKPAEIAEEGTEQDDTQ